jgi:HEAT repeat protein
LLASSAQAADSTGKTEATALVQELRTFPPSIGLAVRPGRDDPHEPRRHEIYRRLRALNTDAASALSLGLQDPDIGVRRNAALALAALAGNSYETPEAPLDIRSCLPALIRALRDRDGMVRARAAHAIGEIGPEGSPAVPALLQLLKNSDEGSRIGACIALKGIGPNARASLPALRIALTDPSNDVRQFAAHAIERIEESSQKGP